MANDRPGGKPSCAIACITCGGMGRMNLNVISITRNSATRVVRMRPVRRRAFDGAAISTNVGIGISSSQYVFRCFSVVAAPILQEGRSRWLGPRLHLGEPFASLLQVGGEVGHLHHLSHLDGLVRRGR